MAEVLLQVYIFHVNLSWWTWAYRKLVSAKMVMMTVMMTMITIMIKIKMLPCIDARYDGSAIPLVVAPVAPALATARELG